MANNKFDFKRVIIAVGAGAAYGGASQLAATKIAFVNDNYSSVRAAGALLLGSGMQYFGSKSEDMKAAGYALLGVAGDSGARWVANLIQGGDSTDAPPASDESGETVQGLGRIKERHRKMLENVCAQVKKKAPERTGMSRRPSEVRTNSVAPASSVRTTDMNPFLSQNIWAGNMGLY